VYNISRAPADHLGILAWMTPEKLPSFEFAFIPSFVCHLAFISFTYYSHDPNLSFFLMQQDG
jgi:hypothetical protein